MLTPSQYDAVADQIVDLYAQLNESIVEDIARRIMETGTISESARWQLKQLQESGMLYDDVIAEISRINYQSQQEIQNLFRNAGIESVRNDNIFYKPTGNQVLRLSDSALQVLNAGYQKCAGNLQNLTLTTANNAQQLYLDACNLAYLQVTSGAMDYGTAIRKAVQMASQQGSMVSYPSGHRDQLDVAVRRAVLTGVGQTVRQISVINANDMGCDLMEITAHAGARPSHAHWQGQIVSLSGRRGYLTVRDIGYGDADGFGGINCRHDWYPFFEGISQRAYSPERLQELENHRIQIGDNWYTDYEVSQMQRRLERDIREKKRLVAGARASVDSAPDEPTKKQMQELFTNASVRLKKAEKKLDDFCNQTGFRKDNNRVWVNGFGRSTSQKAVWANSKAISSSSHVSEDEFNSPIENILKKFRDVLDKSQKDAIIKSKGIEQTLKSIGFVSVDNSFIQNVDKQLQLSIVEKLEELERKFSAIQRSVSPKISANLQRSSIACVSHKTSNPSIQSLVLSPTKFKNKKRHISARKKEVKKHYCMPCLRDKETLSVYVVTHEYGHMLENILIYERSMVQNVTFDDIAKQIKDEIILIAQGIDSNFNLQRNLSVYGTKNDKEFFAEVFANSQLGKPNVLGQAMLIWLQKEGF